MTLGNGWQNKIKPYSLILFNDLESAFVQNKNDVSNCFTSKNTNTILKIYKDYYQIPL